MRERPVILNGISIPYELPVEALLQQLYPARPQAWAACMALGYHPSQEAIFVLLNLLDSTDWRYRRSAIEAIVYHPLAKMHLERICQLLGDPSVYVKRTACEAVGKLKAKQALPQLIPLLSSADPETRTAVIRALPHIWESDLFERVLEIYLNDPSSAVRKAAGWVLMDVADETNWERLFHIWKHDPVGRHRKWACELARRFGSENLNSDLQALSRDRDGHVRKAAKEALEWNR